MGITWTDVRLMIPQAMTAETAEAGLRRVMIILLLDRANSKPYQVICTLWDQDRRVDEWRRAYGGRLGTSSAMQGYEGRRQAAERWLKGVDLKEVKVKGW